MKIELLLFGLIRLLFKSLKLNKDTVNIVWLKRDIRSQDHEPLFNAENSNLKYYIIYIFEPSIIAYPDTSFRHLIFIYHSILALNKILATYNQKVEIFYGEAIEVFFIHQ